MLFRSENDISVVAVDSMDARKAEPFHIIRKLRFYETRSFVPTMVGSAGTGSVDAKALTSMSRGTVEWFVHGPRAVRCHRWRHVGDGPRLRCQNVPRVRYEWGTEHPTIDLPFPQLRRDGGRSSAGGPIPDPTPTYPSSVDRRPGREDQ